MKKFLLSTAVALGLLCVSQVQAANTNFAALQFSITAISTATNVVNTTNHTTGVVTSTLKTSTNTLTTADVLSMLATEYGTTFPAGAKLAVDVTGGGGQFQVVSSNFVSLLDVSANLTFTNLSSNPSAFQFRETFNAAHTNGTFNFIDFEGDSGIAYRDSHGNDFHILGFLKRSQNVSFTSTATTTPSFDANLTGSGGGTYTVKKTGEQLFGVFSKATVTASAKNLKGGGL